MPSANDALALSHVSSSNLPASDKGFVMRMAARYGLSGHAARVAKAKTYAISGGQAVRTGAETALVGGLLGAASVHLKTGLDFEVINKGVLKASVPLDAVVGAVALAGSVLTAEHEASTDLRNAGGAAIAVFSYRKTQDFLAEKMLADNSKLPAGAQKVPGFMTHKQDTAQAKQLKSQVAGDFGTDYGAEDPIVSIARSL